jgi:hypothetical protein
MLAPMTDRTSKILLLLIALGLWANVAVPLFRPASVKAEDLDDIGKVMNSMAKDLHGIHNGICLNSKIC